MTNPESMAIEVGAFLRDRDSEQTVNMRVPLADLRDNPGHLSRVLVHIGDRLTRSLGLPTSEDTARDDAAVAAAMAHQPEAAPAPEADVTPAAEPTAQPESEAQPLADWERELLETPAAEHIAPAPGLSDDPQGARRDLVARLRHAAEAVRGGWASGYRVQAALEQLAGMRDDLHHAADGLTDAVQRDPDPAAGDLLAALTAFLQDPAVADVLDAVDLAVNGPRSAAQTPDQLQRQAERDGDAEPTD